MGAPLIADYFEHLWHGLVLTMVVGQTMEV